MAVPTIERALMLFLLGELPSEELTSIATDALVAGMDSPSLRELAGTKARDFENARALFLKAVEELGFRTPTRGEARWYLVRSWAREMLDGSLSPYEASELIWWRGWDELGRPASLSPFVALATEWQEDESRRSLYESDMLAAARRLLQGES